MQNSSKTLTRSLVFVGLMGVGKTAIGRRVAKTLAMPFVDADEEIEKAAGRPVCDIFEDYGEKAFRDGECKVIARLLSDGPIVLATGGGAFINEETRKIIKDRAISIWLKADLETMVKRTGRRDTRPLLKNGDPKQILANLMEQRYPIYGEADHTIDANGTSLDATVNKVLTALSPSQHNHGIRQNTGT